MDLSGSTTDLQSSLSATPTSLFSNNLLDGLGVLTFQVSRCSIISVNSTADVVDEFDGVTTLREAINFANAEATEDAIVFERSLFSSKQTISLSLGQLSITHSLSIIAPRDELTGENLLTVSGNSASRVFEIGTEATVNFSGLIVANGKATGDDGGGIKNSGTLTLENSIISGSAQNGGGIDNIGSLTVNNSTISGTVSDRRIGSYDSGRGAGIQNTGTLKVSNSTVSGSLLLAGGYAGGGIYNTGSLTVNNSTIRGFSGGGAMGGGIYNSRGGTIEVNNSTISGTASIGGGICNTGTIEVNNSNISGTTTRDGGGIYNNGTLTLSNSTVSRSSSVREAGGGIYNGGSLTVSNSTISGNWADFAGGGIYNNNGTVQVSNSTISDNSAATGGGIFTSGRIFEVSNSTISGNKASRDGGGIFISRSLTTVSKSTISGNKASGNGGGIFSDSSSGGLTTVSNSTISGNKASGNGGGIYNNSVNLTLLFSTLTLNEAANGGGVYNNPGSGVLRPGTTSSRNTMIAGNLLSTDGINPDVAGIFISNGYNLIGDTTGSNGFDAIGDIVGTSDNPIDPLLGLLFLNGGTTATHALLPNSLAIDAGDPTVLDTDPTTDQRGNPRVSGVISDIGAFELS